MNVLVPAILAALVPLVFIVIVSKISSRYLRAAGVLGAAISFGLALVTVLLQGHGESISTLGPFVFHFDAVAASLSLPMTLAIAVIMLATPQKQLTTHMVNHAMGLLSAGLFAILADNPVTLITAEIISALWAASLIREGYQGRALRLFMGISIVAYLASIVVLGHMNILVQPFSQIEYTLAQEMYIVTGLLGLAVMNRLGVFPWSIWMAGTFEHSRGAQTLLAMVPMAGVAPAIYLVEPMLEALNPHMLHTLVPVLLGAAVTSAALGLVQNNLSRSFAFLLSSVEALILAGALDSSPMGVTGSEILWASTLLGATGFGLTVVVSMARVNDCKFSAFGGLAAHTPALALFFLILGAAMTGIPGTTGFVGAELILNGSVSHGIFPLILIVTVLCVQGLSVMRLFFTIFYGTPVKAAHGMELMTRERVAFFGMVIILILGGLLPSIIPLISAAA